MTDFKGRIDCDKDCPYKINGSPANGYRSTDDTCWNCKDEHLTAALGEVGRLEENVQQLDAALQDSWESTVKPKNEEVIKLKAENEHLKGFCDKFVWEEDNPPPGGYPDREETIAMREEIAALKAEMGLAEKVIGWRNAEIAALKAENEKLKNEKESLVSKLNLLGFSWIED